MTNRTCNLCITVFTQLYKMLFIFSSFLAMWDGRKTVACILPSHLEEENFIENILTMLSIEHPSVGMKTRLQLGTYSPGVGLLTTAAVTRYNAHFSLNSAACGKDT